MATKAFVLPGDHLNPDLLPNRPDVPLKLGPGLRHIPPNTISPTVSGQLCTDARKNAIWIEHNSGRVRSPSLPLPITIATNKPKLVHPHCRRPRHSHHPPFLRRRLLRLHN